MEISMEQLATLSELKDKMDILEMQNRYIHAIDAGKYKTVVDLFDEQGKLYWADARREKKLIGGDIAAIETFFKELSERKVNFVRHYITVPVVTVRGDSARFESYYTTMYLHEKFTRVIAGYYDDQLVRRNGEWKFAEKVFGYAWNEFLLPVSDLAQKDPDALKGWGAFGR